MEISIAPQAQNFWRKAAQLADAKPAGQRSQRRTGCPVSMSYIRLDCVGTAENGTKNKSFLRPAISPVWNWLSRTGYGALFFLPSQRASIVFRWRKRLKLLSILWKICSRLSGWIGYDKVGAFWWYTLEAYEKELERWKVSELVHSFSTYDGVVESVIPK